MDLSSVLLSAALILVFGAFIVYPLLRPAGMRERRTTAEADALAGEREAVLAALRELDFDHATGKVADDDYAAQRAVLVGQGTALLRRLDAARTVDDELEAAVRQARARLAHREATACPQCRRPYQAGDRFCAHCGAALPA